MRQPRRILNTQYTNQLLKRAGDVFSASVERGRESSSEEPKAPRVKVVHQALEIEFVSGALDRIDGPSAKR